MADYIDRQAALDAINIEREYMTRRQEWGAEHILTHYGYRIIADMPSADVVPVVRCKDCNHNFSKKHNKRYNHEDIVCDYWETDGMRDDDFCSYGTRMDGDIDG